jgi:hypothetical protein
MCSTRLYAKMFNFTHCWRTQKCQNLCVPHAFLEGKKAWLTFPLYCFDQMSCWLPKDTS